MITPEPIGLQRQPKSIDLFNINKFKMNIHRLSYLDYFCQNVTIPGVTVPDFIQPSMHTNIRVPGTVVAYEDLDVTFLVTDDFKNWLELYDWTTRLTPTRSFKEIYPIGEKGKDNLVYSDLTITVLSNKSNRTMEFEFKRCFPIALTSIQLDASTIDASTTTATVTFAYSGYTVTHKDDNKQLPVS